MALPDPRKRILQERAKAERAAQKEADKQLKLEQSSYHPSDVPKPKIIQLQTPFSYKGCNVYCISKQAVLISNSDKCFLSLVKTEQGFNVYRIPDHTKLDDPLLEQNQPYEQIDAQTVKSIIDRAFSL